MAPTITPLRAGALVVVLAAAILDARQGRIPNALTLPALAVGLALGSPLWAVGAALPLLWLFRRGQVGGGDVKLFAALGALLGPWALALELAAVLAAWATGYRRLGVWALAGVAVVGVAFQT